MTKASLPPLPDNLTYSDFWLDKDALEKYIPDDQKGNIEANFSMDLIQLAAYRRIISNFVSILTGQNIPVQFMMVGDENFTDGKTVWLSASVRKKADFDWTVGLALHEGSHILLSDFDLLKLIYNRIPQSIKDVAKAKNISNEQLAYISKWVFNVVEDRYVDSFIFHEAPGYRGYYQSMYNRLWNSEEISKALKSKMYRVPNLLAYEMRVINITNPDQDLDALIGLRKIAELIDLTNIFRLKTTRERMECAFQVVEVIVSNLGVEPPKMGNTSDDTIDKVTDIIDKHFDLPPGKKLGKGKGGKGGKPEKQDKKGDKTEESDKKDNKKSDKKEEKKNDNGNSPTNSGTKSDSSSGGNNSDVPFDAPSDSPDDLDKIIGGIESEIDKADEADAGVDDEGDVSEFSKKELDKVRKDLDKQRELLKHDYRKIKERITAEEKALLDVIEKYGIILLPAGFGMGLSKPGDYNHAAVDCIVVQKLTKDLILSGSDVFPMAAVESVPGGDSRPPVRYEEAVNKGWTLGKLLGKKLQVRGEENITKYIRKLTGKIEKRLLAGIGAGLEDVFHKTMTQKYNRARLHISIDASSSMNCDQKWLPTMTCLTAICVAAASVENLGVSVSFRTTHRLSDGTELPYIVLAYDSDTDKISKVKNLFPYLEACGCTPEGLAFEAIMEKFIVGKKSDGQDHYFLNLSDGEPYYHLSSATNKYGTSFSYNGEAAVQHTRKQVEKIRATGVNVLSYFISSESVVAGKWGYNPSNIAGPQIEYHGTLGGQFQKMYGKDAKFIQVNSVTDLAKTINQLFLDKE
jgi:hypothetical protein